MQLKTGKEEIVCLLTKVLERYESQTGQAISRNSNRKNYEEVAKVLSEISNNLPRTAGTLHHEGYSPDYNPRNLEYPFRKYDITGNQIKDAYFNRIVANPRPFLVDACYIYLYGVGRKGFEANPIDADLLVKEEVPEPEVMPTTTKVKSFYLRNGLLDSVPNETLKKLLDENSILLREPKEGVILQKQ